MNETRYRWVLGAAAVVLAVTLSAIAYDIGFSQGAARAVASSASATAGTQPTPPPEAYEWRGHRGWGSPLFPMLFIFFWVFLFSRFWWWGGPPRPWWRHYYGGPSDRETFDEWHRRAHDQMKG